MMKTLRNAEKNSLLTPPKMKISATFLLLLPVLIATTVSSTDFDSVRVNELLSLQSSSPSNVIHLDDNSIRRFLSNTPPRSYSLLIFFDADQLHDKNELRLKELFSEFGLLSSSYYKNNPETSSRSKIFFCHVEFKESQSSFGLFGVSSLPHIRLVGPHVTDLKDSEQMNQGDFSRFAESMSDFVESRTKLTVGPIHRPPMFSKTQLAIGFVIFVVWGCFVFKKVIAGETMLHDKKVWLAGAVFIYFFSVSGAMHNIIRKMPMFIADRSDPNKLIFFYQGSGMQLGAEGFAVGFLYSIVGLLLAFVTHVLVQVRNVNAQRGVMIVALFISFWAVSEVVYLDNWKTGYGIHGFWPSSWK